MRSFVAGLALFLSFLTGTAALEAFVVHEVLLDPDRAGQVLDSALRQPDTRAKILAQVVPGYDRLPGVARAGVDALAGTPEVSRVARQVTVTRTGEVSLTPLRTELARGLRDNGLTGLARVVSTADVGASVQVPSTYMDRFNQARDTSWFIATQGAILTAMLVIVALLASRRRGRTVRGAGLVVLACSVVAVVLFWLLPAVVRAVGSDSTTEVVAVVVESQRHVALLTLAPFAVGGAVLVVLGMVFAGGGRRRSVSYD